MKNTSIIAIDFGTSRTKMAYFDAETNSTGLFRIGEDERKYIPSSFYLSKDTGAVHYGDEALYLGKDDPSGLLENPLKRCLRQEVIIAGNRQKSTPKILLQVLLSGLRQKVTQHPLFSKITSYKVVFTIPAQYSDYDESIIREAAVNSGFAEDRISFICEPVAAARAWFVESNHRAGYLIVLDCGGGTLDWACLKQTKPGNFELIPDLPPGGDVRIGGYDIDEEMFMHLLSNVSEKEEVYCRKNKNVIIKRLQGIKEKYSRTNTDTYLQLSESKFHFSVNGIEMIVNERFVKQVLSAVTPFINRARSVLHIENPDLLLVGGSAKFPLLVNCLTNSGICTPLVWERSDYATVIGASLATFNIEKDLQEPKEQKSLNSKAQEIFDEFNNKPSNIASTESTITSTSGPRDAESQYNLGNSYYNGEGVAQDYKAAVHWYRLAAEQGYADSQYMLGLCCYNGQGVAQDYMEAVKWFRLAAEQGDADSQYNLGYFYYNGQGVAQDYKAAVHWYQLAADQGHADAQHMLGFCHYNGQGVAQDYKAAVHWYQLAAEQGDADSQYMLGLCCYNGEGVAKGYKAAVHWYRLAAEQGHAIAQYMLGSVYHNGEGVAKEYLEAVKWFKLAAEQGLADAQYMLGFCYDNGLGVTKDYKTAKHLYRLAAEQGFTGSR